MRLRRRAPLADEHAGLTSFDLVEVVDKAPNCIIVADEAANIVFRNKAAVALAARVAALYGDSMLRALRDGIAAERNGSHVFPVTIAVAYSVSWLNRAII